MLKVIAVDKKRPKQMSDGVWDQYIRMKQIEAQGMPDLYAVNKGACGFVLDKYRHGTKNDDALSSEDFLGRSWEDTRIDLIWDHLEGHEKSWLRSTLLILDYYLDENYRPIETRVEGNVIHVKGFEDNFNKIFKDKGDE